MKIKYAAKEVAPSSAEEKAPNETNAALVAKEIIAALPAQIAMPPAKEGRVNLKLQNRSMADR